MTATLDEWIFELEGVDETLDALIEEEENQLQLQTQEQAILKSSAIVDISDIAIEPFDHPIALVRKCSVEVHYKRSVPNLVPNVIPNSKSTKKLAIKKQINEEILNQNLDSSSYSKNRVTE